MFDDDEIFGVPVSTSKGPIDFSAIHAMFNSATASGLKKPRFYADNGLYFSLAPSTGRNPGAIYITVANDYIGKVVNNKLTLTKQPSDAVMDTIRTVAADPKAAAFSYGHKTGTCCMCARELTNAVSVRLGIGPICGGRWGFYSATEADDLENEVEPVGKFSDPVEVASTTVAPVVIAEPKAVIVECSRVMVEVNGNMVVDTDEVILEYFAGVTKPFRVYVRNEKGNRWFNQYETRKDACEEFNTYRADRREYLMGL